VAIDDTPITSETITAAAATRTNNVSMFINPSIRQCGGSKREQP
jgi:hypothetical protein